MLLWLHLGPLPHPEFINLGTIDIGRGSFVVETVLCYMGHFTASLASTPWMPVLSTPLQSYDNQECFQTVLNVPWEGTKSHLGENHRPKPTLQRFSPVFPSKSFVTLARTFRPRTVRGSLLCLVWGKDLNFSFCPWVLSWPSTICWKDYALTHWITLSKLYLCKKELIGINVSIYFWTPVSVGLMYMSVSVAGTTWF